MIPEWRTSGLLPPGVHEATFGEIEARLAFNAHRAGLFIGLVRACGLLADAGCTGIYLDGSYVTNKPDPGDFDACWDSGGVDISRLDAVFFDFAFGREEQKRRFGGELFPSNLREGATGGTFLELFQEDEESGAPKGIVLIRPCE
jgi:hypothetical protein